MSTIHDKSEVKKFIRWPKSHAEWNTLLLYVIPIIGVLIGVLVFLIRFISSRL